MRTNVANRDGFVRKEQATSDAKFLQKLISAFADDQKDPVIEVAAQKVSGYLRSGNFSKLKEYMDNEQANLLKQMADRLPWKQLYQYRTLSGDYVRLHDFPGNLGARYSNLRALFALISKNELIVSPTAEEVARQTLFSNLKRMRSINATFESGGLTLRTQQYLSQASRLVTRLFGTLGTDTENLHASIKKHARHGPGSTTSVPRRLATQARKFAWPNLSGSKLAIELLKSDTDAQALFTEWSNAEIKSLSSVNSVPKNMWTERSIAQEEILSLYYQLGLGAVIRTLLLQVGINLRDQRPNQDLAREGSLTGYYATVDMKSASDSISTSLTWSLFQQTPAVWDALMGLRGTHLVEKGNFDIEGASTPFSVKVSSPILSSMGNGFTFPVETVVFWAITKVIMDRNGLHHDRVLVYGDDIVCPCSVVPELTEVFSELGVIVNTEKTHSTDSVLRESCGTDWINGTNVRPAYFSSREPVSLMAFHNATYRDSRYESIRKFLRSSGSIELLGPAEVAANWFWTDNRTEYKLRRNRHTQRLQCRALQPCTIDERRILAADENAEFKNCKIDNWDYRLEEATYRIRLRESGVSKGSPLIPQPIEPVRMNGKYSTSRGIQSCWLWDLQDLREPCTPYVDAIKERVTYRAVWVDL